MSGDDVRRPDPSRRHDPAPDALAFAVAAGVVFLVALVLVFAKVAVG